MIELAKVIQGLREELQSAIVTADSAPLRFELGPIELEVSVAIDMAGQTGTKVRFWVVEAGAQGTVERTTTQRLKLTLTPQLGPDATTPFVSGRAEENER